jgi:predicted ATPase/class 3 adenylate cyclase
MTSPPTPSQLTFLFTDVEGSARLWEALPEAMPEALAEHFRLVGEAIEGVGGKVVKETGDGIFAVFPVSKSAVGAAVAAQRALSAAAWDATGPLKARMGLHSGTAILEHDDYHGVDVNRCARLMGTAHGGQVIVSEATFALVRDDAPPGVTFLDLGEHRLKDLARPERIHQIVHPDLVAEFPPLRSMGAFPNNLPAELSSFIGRKVELAAVQDALSRARLVTLTGAGGAGKTRLALQVAADRIERHPNGVWLADLAGLSDPLLVAQAVVSALRVAEPAGRPALEVLTAHLVSRDLLVVLDNCEHLITSAAELVDAVLRASPKVRFVATSREPLNVSGEITWRVPSLSIPEEASGTGAAESEAVALFVERARAADPTFTLTAESAPVVTTICRRLDGLPLAIELAAARVRALSVEEIAARLQDRFSLLTGGARTALPRQRTLEAAVGWSYDLLTRDERRLFARLSIFAGTFDLAAVEEVCSDDGIERDQVLDLLAKLVDKSLVSALHVSGRTRYRLLETLRDYARNKLSTARDAKAVRDAHTRWAVAFAEAAGRQVLGPDQPRWLADIEANLDDLRAALQRTIDADDRETGMRIMVALEQWWPIGALREARHWLELLLADGGAIAPAVLGHARSLYGVVLMIQGEQKRGVEAEERALALLRDAGDLRGAAWATHQLGIGRWQSAQPEVMKALTLEALAAFEELNEPIGILRCLWWLVLWELEFGNAKEANGYGARLQEQASHTPAPLARAHAAEAAGLLARLQGNLDEAASRLREAVVLHAMVRNVGCLSHCLEHVALWSLDRREPLQAATLLGAVDGIREDIVGNAAVPAFERMWHERATSAAREALGEDAFATAWGSGRAMSIEQSIAAGLRSFGPGEAGV